MTYSSSPAHQLRFLLKAFGFALTIVLAITAPAQTNVRALAERVDHYYNSLRTLQADFTETYTGGGMVRREAGTLWLKRPGRMRWDYSEPRQKLFLTDGHTAWFYVPGEKQARKAPVKSLDDLRSPLAYLLGRTKLEKEFRGLSLAPDIKPETAADVVLRGVPRHLRGITEVVMEIEPDGSFSRLQVEQEDGTSISFRFLNQKENVAIPDQRFHFTPPPGVETIETPQLGE